ncbi:MAG: hypothetical protein HGA53_02300 [Anaerolineaceae bacterium]|nr:hypothetical protein [Anaerolineaceae bacterium]
MDVYNENKFGGIPLAKKGNLTKALAIAGTVLVWFPIFATIVTSVFGSLRSGMFRFDYLMPAELFPVAFIGGGLLFWAALRARSRQKLIGWGLASIVVLRVGGQAIAVASGLASGETEPVGWILVVAIASIVLYTLTLIEIGIAGVLLTRDLFQT